MGPTADLRISKTGKISDLRRESNCAKQPVVLKECRYVLNVAAITLREVATYITTAKHLQNYCSENIDFALLIRSHQLIGVVLAGNYEPAVCSVVCF
jgi:hypothetical protein